MWLQDASDHLLLGASCSEEQKRGFASTKPSRNSADLGGYRRQTSFFCWLKGMDWLCGSLFECGSDFWSRFVHFVLFIFLSTRYVPLE